MRNRLLGALLLGLLLWAQPASAAVTVKFTVQAGGTDTTTRALTAAVNTSGSTLFVAVITHLTSAGTIHDSQSNTWTTLNTVTSGARTVTAFYVINPTTNASHTFDQTATPGFDSLSVVGFDPNTPVFDTQNTGGTSAGTTVQPGSLTPGGATNLFLVSLGGDNQTSATIDSGFAVACFRNTVGSTNFGSGLAWLEQAAATAQNPTWTVGGNGSAILAASFTFTFTGGGGGGPPGCKNGLLMQGVGCEAQL